MDIVQCIQERVDKLVRDKYASDECPPIYTVSVLYEGATEHKLILTIQHCEMCFSSVIFPRPEMKFGYEPLEYEIIQLYNQTM